MDFRLSNGWQDAGACWIFVQITYLDSDIKCTMQTAMQVFDGLWTKTLS